jgi:hypothetical protein
MSRTPQRHELMRKWAEAVVPVEDHEASERRRERVVASTARAIERGAAEARAVRRRTKWGASLAAAAVLLLAVGAVWRARVRANDVAVRTAPVEAPPLPASPGDDVVTTSDGAIHLDLSNGAAITLEPASSFHLPDPHPSPNGSSPVQEQARLDVGAVRVHVPPLAAGHTFAIKTPDAVVTVHGTSFTVEVGEFANADAPRLAPASPSGQKLMTRVSVSEGTVSVSHQGREVFIGAGMRWISPRVEPRDEASAAAPDNGPRPRAPSAARPVAPSSDLAEENRLFRAEKEAAKAGRYRAAVEILNDLLQRFPTSPFAQEARVDRFRALKSAGDQAGAAREAQSYLALYPNGFAREEAKKIGTER